MGKTSSFAPTVSPVAVRANMNAQQVKVFENTGTPTTPFLISMPTASDVATYHASGSSFTFLPPNGTTFNTGQVVGYISLPTGSTATPTFAQEEF